MSLSALLGIGGAVLSFIGGRQQARAMRQDFSLQRKEYEAQALLYQFLQNDLDSWSAYQLRTNRRYGTDRIAAITGELGRRLGRREIVEEIFAERDDLGTAADQEALEGELTHRDMARAELEKWQEADPDGFQRWQDGSLLTKFKLQSTQLEISTADTVAGYQAAARQAEAAAGMAAIGARISRRNAAEAKRLGREATEAGDRKLWMHRYALDRTLGKTLGRQAASGISLSSRSAIAVRRGQRLYGEIEALDIRRKSASEALHYAHRAENALLQAEGQSLQAQSHGDRAREALRKAGVVTKLGEIGQQLLQTGYEEERDRLAYVAANEIYNINHAMETKECDISHRQLVDGFKLEHGELLSQLRARRTAAQARAGEAQATFQSIGQIGSIIGQVAGLFNQPTQQTSVFA